MARSSTCPTIGKGDQRIVNSAPHPRIELKALGPLEAWIDGRPVDLGPLKQRALLALLLLSANRVVSIDHLAEGLWPTRPPSDVSHNVAVHVSRLRRALPAERELIVRRGAGYALVLAEDELDVLRFERLARDGHGALALGRLEEARTRLGAALELWRGPLLADLAPEFSGGQHALLLEERRLRALEGRIDAELALGGHADVTEELRALVREHPERERFSEQLMVGLYRSGRQREALAEYRRKRRELLEAYGIEPGLRLRELERAILNHDLRLRAPARRPPSNLPAPLTGLVGRPVELEALVDLVIGEGVRLVTLVGTAGVGKTRLALEAGAALRDGFPGGVHLVELAALEDADGVPGAIAGAIGVEPEEARPLADVLAEALADVRSLLVLDNFEHVRPAGPAVASLLERCPNLHVLATSRSALRLRGERPFAVEPLTLPTAAASPEEIAASPAVRLLLERARAGRPELGVTDENAGALADICRRLDGLPLAIELAAPRLAALGAEELRQRLDPVLPLLTAGARDLPARQQTLRAAIAWSVGFLGERERILLGRLGVFAGGCTSAAAALVCEVDDLDHGLGLLVEASLVRPRPAAGGDRFELLVTIEELARDLLEHDDEAEATHARHAGYFLTLAEEAAPELTGSGQMRWIELLDAERANLRRAVGWAAERGEHELVARLVTSLWRFWERRGAAAEARAWIEPALAAGDLSLTVRARALGSQARFMGRKGDYAASGRLWRESLELCRRIGDRAGESAALAALSWWSSQVAGRLHEAVGLGGEAVAVARQLGDPVLRWEAANVLGVALLVSGERERAEPLFEECLALARERGDEHGTCSSLGNLAHVAQARGRHRRASELGEEALELARALLDDWLLVHLLGFLAEVALVADDRERAAEQLAEAYAAGRRLGEGPMVGGVLESVARMASERHPAEAARLAGAAARLLETAGVHVDGVGEPPWRAALAERLGRDFGQEVAAGEQASDDAIESLVRRLTAQPPSARPGEAACRS